MKRRIEEPAVTGDPRHSPDQSEKVTGPPLIPILLIESGTEEMIVTKKSRSRTMESRSGFQSMKQRPIRQRDTDEGE